MSECKIPNRRINVRVDEATARALENIMGREGVTLPEAVRRLVGYGDVLSRAVHEDGATVHLKQKATLREVTLL
jgi:hypothetical protein